jgi:hypothetical protein
VKIRMSTAIYAAQHVEASLCSDAFMPLHWGVLHCTGSGNQSGGEAIHYDVEEAKRARHQKAALAFSHRDVSFIGIPFQSFYIYHQYVLYHIGHSP